MLRSLNIPADAAAMGQVLDFVAAFAIEHHLPHEEVARVSIVLEELLTNTVKYGYEGSDGRGRVEISLEFVEARLTIQFVDDAREFDPFTVALPDISDDTDSRSVGGLGLQVVRALADERRYRRDSGRNIIFLARKVSVRSKPKSST